jgi:hypothetical protein
MSCTVSSRGYNMDNEILRIETEVKDKNYGYVYSYYERDPEITEPIPEKPRAPGIYHVVYRSPWDMLMGRSIQEVLDRDAKQTYDDWVKRKEQEKNRKSYDFR